MGMSIDIIVFEYDKLQSNVLNAIKSSGLKVSFVYDKMNISKSTFRRKCIGNKFYSNELLELYNIIEKYKVE